MRVFSDFHHEELYESLSFLFVDRLGFGLYRPIGLDWYHQNLWKVFDHPATAQQYLGVDGYSEEVLRLFKEDPHFNKLNLDPQKASEGIYQVKSPMYDHWHNAITLEAFKNTKFDILLCSMPQHIPIFNQLQRLYQPQAKVVWQIGNNWGNRSDVKNVLSSSKITKPIAGQNFLHYHQEFDLDVFKYSTDKDTSSVFNMQHIMSDRRTLDAIMKTLPYWKLNIFGAGNGGPVPGPRAESVYEPFKKYGFLFHCKQGGDGYGYNIFHAAATGTPIIFKGSYVRGQTAEPLLEHGVTGIDLDKVNPEDAARKMTDECFYTLSTNIYNRFKQLVNFDEEEKQIRKFIENLQ